MNQPKVSVIMPSLNVVSYIRECIESVVNQTLKDIEIICVDAGSTDGTLEVLEEYAAKDDRIRLLHSDKKSYGYQMNMGIDAATGEYIGIVETDDYIKFDMYEVLYNTAAQYQVDFVKSDLCKFWDEEKRIYERMPLTGDKSLYYKVLNPSKSPSLLRLTMNNVSGIYSREFLKTNSIHLNESPGASFQDNGLWFQIFTLAQSAIFIDRTFYCIRRDNPNSSVNNPNKVYIMCDEYDYIYEFLKKDSARLSFFMPYYIVKKYDNYLFTYNRISDEYKLEFLQRFRNEFIEYQKKGLIIKDAFSKSKISTLNSIIANPERYFYLHSGRMNCDIGLEDIDDVDELRRQLSTATCKYRQAENEVRLIKQSVSFRIGYAITFIPRTIRTLCNYMSTYGLRRTFKKIYTRLFGERCHRK